MSIEVLMRVLGHGLPFQMKYIADIFDIEQDKICNALTNINTQLHVCVFIGEEYT